MRLGMLGGSQIGVLGPEGGRWQGWTADTANNPSAQSTYDEQDQWAGGPGRVSWTPPYTEPSAGFTDPHVSANNKYDSNILPGPNPQKVQSIDDRGHFPVEPKWPQGGYVTRPLDERRYDVQRFTSYSVSTVRAGQWARGARAGGGYVPIWHPAKPPIMYDPTDPDTWNVVRAYN